MLSAVTAFAATSVAAAQPNHGESDALARFAKADANKDGKVTSEERKAAFEAFRAEHAAKRAGRGERTDKGPRGERGERGERPARPDADKTFTKAEVSATLKEHFSKLDKNSDGKLTQDEPKFGKRGHHGPRGECGKKTDRS